MSNWAHSRKTIQERGDLAAKVPLTWEVGHVELRRKKGGMRQTRPYHFAVFLAARKNIRTVHRGIGDNGMNGVGLLLTQPVYTINSTTRDLPNAKLRQ